MGAALGAALMTTTASADWNVGDPHAMDDVFLPDLSALGMDVNASFTATGSSRHILFDDFLGNQAGPITGIHLWGSWRDDALPGGSAGNVSFILSVHGSIKGEQESQPDMTDAWVQTFRPGEFTYRSYATGLNGGWMEPGGAFIPNADTICWQYSFPIDPAEAFRQRFDERYWLNVTAIPDDPNSRWGWKTATVDTDGKANLARWSFERSPQDVQHDPDPQLVYLVYPPGHPNGPDPPDHWWTAADVGFAFVMTPEPASLTLFALGAMVLAGRPRIERCQGA